MPLRTAPFAAPSYEAPRQKKRERGRERKRGKEIEPAYMQCHTSKARERTSTSYIYAISFTSKVCKQQQNRAIEFVGQLKTAVEIINLLTKFPRNRKTAVDKSPQTDKRYCCTVWEPTFATNKHESLHLTFRNGSIKEKLVKTLHSSTTFSKSSPG